jgi:tRNA(adenine34) deaminase
VDYAEILAIAQAGVHVKNYHMLDCTLYVTLEPCVMCAGLLIHSRIKRLVFATNDFKTGADGSAFDLVTHEKHNHSVQITSGVMELKCSALLSSFLNAEERKKTLK